MVADTSVRNDWQLLEQYPSTGQLCSAHPRPSRTGISVIRKLTLRWWARDAWCNPSSQLLPLHSWHQKYKALFINCWCLTTRTARRLLSVRGGCSLLRSVQLAVPSWQHSPHLASSHTHATERWQWHSLRVREWEGAMFSSVFPPTAVFPARVAGRFKSSSLSRMCNGWSISTLLLLFLRVRCHNQAKVYTPGHHFNYVYEKVFSNLICEYTQKLEKKNSKQWGFAPDRLDTACSVSQPSGNFPSPTTSSFVSNSCQQEIRTKYLPHLISLRKLTTSISLQILIQCISFWSPIPFQKAQLGSTNGLHDKTVCF